MLGVISPISTVVKSIGQTLILTPYRRIDYENQKVQILNLEP